jgi:hypothetical protein
LETKEVNNSTKWSSIKLGAGKVKRSSDINDAHDSLLKEKKKKAKMVKGKTSNWPSVQAG